MDNLHYFSYKCINQKKCVDPTMPRRKLNTVDNCVKNYDSGAVPGFFSMGVQLLPGGVQNYRNTIPFHIQADVSRFYLF